MNSETPNDFSLLHEIFILDAHLEETLDETQHESITNKLVNSLLSALDMVKLGDLQIHHAVDLRAPGWSFIQPITTSHISGHYFEKPGRLPHIRMDMYSCRAVDWKRMIEVVNENLYLADWRATFIRREIERDGSRDMIDIYGKGAEIASEFKMFQETDLRSIEQRVKKEHLHVAEHVVVN
ncbi:hypothetical protein HN512_03410 [Candidatus Peregrinibacteria bacterium]|jgi:hypothetical protein|nr:hypothetical protein [Candidatus Peregrinibacteria bacterium]MBT3598860.1 hypothetical protein [Candidatus Peregrinibacteria bacterium]MBT4366798.1 hypothetical protein [Candidatus Peregrinibacteria bacterium]MBT4585929.1 hypothetical protein [Candidatus Peregrinibacteria bacterium]MBT6731091.1 hypothetical protein [Candidatus Peregrinibacteria bacterium]